MSWQSLGIQEGQEHVVPLEILVPVLEEFFGT
jgi:hypothetical protein